MHFVMYASSNHVKVLHGVTTIDLLDKSAILSDRVVHNPSAHANIYPFNS